VEKNTGFEGSRTLIQSGFFAWCNAGSIFVQDIFAKLASASLSDQLRIAGRDSFISQQRN